MQSKARQTDHQPIFPTYVHEGKKPRATATQLSSTTTCSIALYRIRSVKYKSIFHTQRMHSRYDDDDDGTVVGTDRRVAYSV